MERIQPLLGLVVMIGLLILFSSDRKAIRWRIVAWGMGLQIVFALFLLKTPIGQPIFRGINEGFLAIIDATQAGSSFVFGELGDGIDSYLPVGDQDDAGAFQPSASRVANVGMVFAFSILPTIVFFSALMSIGYHLGVIQRIVRAVAKVMSVTMRTSGAETLSASANIFVGQTEAPLMVKPFLGKMTRSELMAVMSGGFATTAGGVLAAYVGFLQELIDDIGAHLMTASVMSAPASLMMAKLLLPETEESATAGDVKIDLKATSTNVLDAAVQGTTDGLKLALNVGAMLLVFVALVALVDMGLAAVGGWFGDGGEPWSLAMIFGKLFWPVAWLLGVPSQDCAAVGQLLGTKTFLNEFVAYIDLANMGKTEGQSGLSERSYLIASYALCGFANFASVGIQIGGIGAIAPERRKDLAQLGLKAMIVGTLAAFSTACVIAILT